MHYIDKKEKVQPWFQIPRLNPNIEIIRLAKEAKYERILIKLIPLAKVYTVHRQLNHYAEFYSFI